MFAVFAPERHLPETRRRTILAVGGMLLLAAVLLSATGCRERRPAYTLAQVKTALAAGDRSLLSRYVDLDAVVTQAVDDAVAQTLAERLPAEPRSPLAQLGVQFARQLAGRLKPAIAARYRQLLEQRLADGETVPPFLAQAEIVEVAREGDQAVIELAGPDPRADARRTNTFIYLERREQRHFVVFAVSDLDLLLAGGDEASPARR